MTNYDDGLERCAANHRPLTPISYLARAAYTHPDHPAVIHGTQRSTYSQLWEDCCRLASALVGQGIGRGDTVSAVLANTPPLIHAHYGVPMANGAVLHTVNTRSDAATIAFQLDHAETRVVIVDREFSDIVAEALTIAKVRPLVIDFDDTQFPPDGPHEKGPRIGTIDYAELLETGDPAFRSDAPEDEWDAITLNYTSGTTGNPKGVVYHHRGAALMALNNVVHADMGKHPVYLWTLPMFHCNGWSFSWTLPVQAGTHVCLRWVRAAAIYDAIADHGVTHLCGAPVVMSTLLNAPADQKRTFPQQVIFNTAAAPPPETVLKGMAAAGFRVTHLYGLTETYGPSVVNEWNHAWDTLSQDEQAARKARQGVRYLSLSDLTVLDPDTMHPVPADGKTLGEVMFRGNVVMKGYLKNRSATEEAFAGGWFHSGDLGVMYPDGYIQLKDRSKDIIISGGENISSIEVEEALYRHPSVDICAVVAVPSPKWGETPCAFVELRPDQAATEEELIEHCRAYLAHYKCPSRVVFKTVPKTSTGKIQKHLLRSSLAKM